MKIFNPLLILKKIRLILYICFWNPLIEGNNITIDNLPKEVVTLCSNSDYSVECSFDFELSKWAQLLYLVEGMGISRIIPYYKMFSTLEIVTRVIQKVYYKCDYIKPLISGFPLTSSVHVFYEYRLLLRVGAECS